MTDVRKSQRAAPHPEDAHITVLVRLASVFLSEARVAADRAKVVDATEPDLWTAPVATAILMAEAASEAELSERLVQYGILKVLSATDAERVARERDHARQWRLLMKRLAPQYKLGGSKEYGALRCLICLRDALAHRNASHNTVGTWPGQLDDCVRQRIIPVRRHRGHLEWTGQLLRAPVAEWAVKTIEGWLRIADSVLPPTDDVQEAKA